MPLTRENLKQLLEDKPDTIEDLITVFIRAEEAKQELRKIDIGWTGLDVSGTVDEAISIILGLRFEVDSLRRTNEKIKDCLNEKTELQTGKR